MEWIINEEMPEGTIGFIYKIIHIPSGKFYIGKKNLYSTLTKPPLQGQRKKRTITKESDWRNYYSSNEWIKEEVKKGHQDHFCREVLMFCTSKRDLTYNEVKYQFKHQVLEDPLSLNSNILGKFFK